MNVAERRRVGQRFIGGRRGRFGEERGDIKRIGGHLDAVVRPQPLLAWAVDIELDAVAVGVRQVERLAHQVIGRALHRIVVGQQTAKRGGERAAVRQQQGEVEEARRTWHAGSCGSVFGEFEERPIIKAQHFAVEASSAFERANGQTDGCGPEHGAIRIASDLRPGGAGAKRPLHHPRGGCAAKAFVRRHAISFRGERVST